MEVKHLSGLSPTLTTNQVERLTSLATYMDDLRTADYLAGKKENCEIYTNVLAHIILIAKDE